MSLRVQLDQVQVAGPVAAIDQQTGLSRAALAGIASGLCLGLITAGGPGRYVASATVQSNPNTAAAGTLHDGVLSVTLEAKSSLWYLDGPRHAAMNVEAFSEPGKPPLVPGPLVRVPAGTALRLTVRNSLSSPLTFYVPVALRDAAGVVDSNDSLVVPPGGVQTLVTRAGVPGNFVYHGETLVKSGKRNALGTGLLAGAIDSAGAAGSSRDRVFVMMAAQDSAERACVDTATATNLVQIARACGGERLHYTINGASWPNTERLHAMVGDSLRWRVINATELSRPMHLHGFYFRVDAFTPPTEPSADSSSRPIFPGQDSAARIANDTLLVRWGLVAKDGFDLPPAAQTPRPAEQLVGMGETWDVELVPARRNLNLEIRAPGSHMLLARVPIRVE